MKTLQLTALIFIFSALQNGIFGQTKTECHLKISSGHKKICEEAMKISNSVSTTKDKKAEQVMTASKTLQEVKREQEQLKHSMPEKFKTIAAPHFTILEKLHSDAGKQLDTLNIELKKELPDNTKVKVSALKLNEIIKSAEHEHLILKADTSPKWATK